ncbi:MAG TPA: hypothetical protein PKE64_29815 [Anaerolineae bacterium]|nr:hypothetical protein [Anaerolineae bacterium]HMR68228.1 hypothetical protein [Anaerolineae bacterium]
MMRGYRAAQMLLTGHQGGILGHLVDAPRPADELADLIGVHAADIQICEGPSQSWKSWPNWKSWPKR